MRRLAAFRKNLKECLEYTRSAEPPEPLPYAVPVAEFLGQCSPGNAVDREIVNCLKEFTVVMPRLSAARLHSVKHFKCDQPIPICHSRQHVRLPAAGHAVIRTKPDSGIRQKCIPGFPSTRPRDLPLKLVVKKCYMKELRSCDGGISGEHLISESIILLLKADGDFTVSGLPWMDDGETKILGSKSLTANRLCRKHNSALSPLDAAALFFFSSLKSCLDREADSMRYLVSGHDIERWLLKTLKTMATSGNLARGREQLSGAFSSDVQVLDMLDDPRHWPEGTGLYCVMNAGDLTENHNRFQLAPLPTRVVNLTA